MNRVLAFACTGRVTRASRWSHLATIVIFIFFVTTGLVYLSKVLTAVVVVLKLLVMLTLNFFFFAQSDHLVVSAVGHVNQDQREQDSSEC